MAYARRMSQTPQPRRPRWWERWTASLPVGGDVLNALLIIVLVLVILLLLGHPLQIR